MRHTVTVDDQVGKAVQNVADEEGISISEFYARAVERELQRRRREAAVATINSMIGKVEIDREGARSDLKEMRDADELYVRDSDFSGYDGPLTIVNLRTATVHPRLGQGSV